MAADLSLLPLNKLQKLPQSQQQHHPTDPNNLPPNAWMWNSKQGQEDDDDSWEVRAFAEDTGNIMGTTWPPRSYTCTFCRKEFRSAQALGGHMNVHRRDRARLHQAQPSSINPNSSSSSLSTSSSTFIIPTQELISTNGGSLCLLYQLPNPDGVFSATPSLMNDACSGRVDQYRSSSTLLSISPFPPNQSLNFSTIMNSSHSYSNKAEPLPCVDGGSNGKQSEGEELDLELRLGHRSKSSP